jgi:acetyl-CoA carboxylase biotin carboxylase subunit
MTKSISSVSRTRPRHIEMQVLGDGLGNACIWASATARCSARTRRSWKRRPRPALTPQAAPQIGGVAIKAMQKLKYRGAGTLEFLYQDGQFAFIEMNTRIQVEHPVSEMISGIDLVQEQIRIAAGGSAGIDQSSIKLTGHAIECRINAENPVTFMPSPGKVTPTTRPAGSACASIRALSGLHGAEQLRQPGRQADRPWRNRTNA